MPRELSEVKAKKKSAFSCECCRTRKVKCTGEQPRCRRCVARNEECIYKLSPTLSYTQRLESRIAELETELAIMQAGDLSSDRSVHVRAPLQVGPTIFRTPTSFFEAANDLTLTKASDSVPKDDYDHRKERLVQNAWQQRSLEVLAETPEPFQYMINNHWCWIQPLFNYIYRPAFTRDMQTMGPYYSHTLLNALLAHSARWCQRDPTIAPLLEPYDNGKLFSRHARTLLFDEVQRGKGSVPIVQTLLLLSAQECGAGNRTQAWLYSGMAFRMIEDMGICVNNESYLSSANDLTDEDVEIRNRLFWSCYFWDKIISLYLGRSPTLRRTQRSPPQLLFDDSAENEIWRPHGISFTPENEYPVTKSHATTCFMQMCRLSVIFHQIFEYMYDPEQNYTEQERQNCLNEQGNALHNWWNDLPDYLKVNPTTLPSHAPPSHIVNMNCLFHTFKILLYRPMLFASTTSAVQPEANHLRECIASANSIVIIYDLFCRTFGNSRTTLSLSYCVYTAASIFLLQIQATAENDPHTLRRLKFCTDTLERSQQQTPILKAALDLIFNQMTQSSINVNIGVSHGIQGDGSMGHHNAAAQAQDSILFDADRNLASPGLTDFDFSDVQIDPSIFDAFYTLEPISVQVGALDEA